MLTANNSTKETPSSWLILSCLFFLFAGCESETAVDKATREGILLMGNTAEPKGSTHTLFQVFWRTTSLAHFLKAWLSSTLPRMVWLCLVLLKNGIQ